VLITNREATGNKPQPTTEYSYVQNNSVIARKIETPERVASLGYRLYEEPVLYTEALRDCVKQIESGGNPLAYNPMDTDGREKFGLYQFGQWEWDNLCTGDKWKAEDQELCFKALIEAGRGRMWPSVSKCLKRL
jgi:hypothetical protein